tara:strand:+ start:228 stop:437 length:210 start_codon:yes stop_codon:yes gene_type:complete
MVDQEVVVALMVGLVLQHLVGQLLLVKDMMEAQVGTLVAHSLVVGEAVVQVRLVEVMLALLMVLMVVMV